MKKYAEKCPAVIWMIYQAADAIESSSSEIVRRLRGTMDTFSKTRPQPSGLVISNLRSSNHQWNFCNETGRAGKHAGNAGRTLIPQRSKGTFFEVKFSTKRRRHNMSRYYDRGWMFLNICFMVPTSMMQLRFQWFDSCLLFYARRIFLPLSLYCGLLGNSLLNLESICFGRFGGFAVTSRRVAARVSLIDCRSGWAMLTVVS